jgi:hydroxyacylglutathione hydrolase
VEKRFDHFPEYASRHVLGQFPLLTDYGANKNDMNISDHNRIDIIPALSDNYIYSVRTDHGAVVLDPSNAEHVIRAATQRGYVIRAILVTHHHFDHTGGVAQLKELFRCPVIGPEDSRIPGVDTLASDGETVTIDGLRVRCVHVPGHTRSHIACYMPEIAALFPGDTIFFCGCGRVFEGTYEQMWRSLQKLMSLPDATLVYSGHEYTEENMVFARTVDPDNRQLHDTAKAVRNKVTNTGISMPSSIGLEKKINPFVRTGDQAIRSKLNMNESSDSDIFTELRKRKDMF